MKVRCIHLADSAGKPQRTSSWLTIGKIYTVLSIVQDIHQRWLLRVLGDEPNGLALFPLQQFEVVSNNIPSNWNVNWNKNGVFSLEPELWAYPGFWDRYYDRDPGAMQMFELESRKILEAEDQVGPTLPAGCIQDNVGS